MFDLLGLLGIEFGVGGVALAFAAGIVSFTSPCVLPLVPGYLSFVSGVGFDDLGAKPKKVVITTGAFVLGFSIMFILLGAGTAWFGSGLLENRRLLEQVGGAFLIVAAIVYAGVPLPRLLAMERKFHVKGAAKGKGSIPTAGLTGVVFAVGWTPCLGPTLAAILSLSFGGSASEAAALLGAYSIGLGLPFLLAGLAFTRALSFMGFLKRHWRIVSYGSAAMLTTMGILLITGDFTRLLTKLARFTGWQI
ncbi:MAG: cytochrome c biogenesis CcdA family protein [Gaiellaceae bacterium]